MKGHTATLRDVAAGIRSLPDAADSFAATRAAWRFFGDEGTTLPVLMQPLLQVADAAACSTCSEVALIACDWCQLHYSRHTSKADCTTLMNQHDLGYELHTALPISDVDGSPIAPFHQSLRSAEGLFQSSTDRVRRKPGDAKLDRLLPVFRFVERRGWPKPPVSIIDRELVGSMACALAWKIGRSVHPTAPSLRAVLIGLSSRQMKHGVGHTEPALLAGLWALLQGLALAEEFDLDHLRQILQEVLCGPEGLPHPGPSPPSSLPNRVV